MSFLDQLSKNLNSQTEFFAQLSNITKDSRKNSEVQKTVEAPKKESTKVQENETELNDTEDKKVEKKDFFSTAKKVFKQYKTKTDKKEETEEPELKEVAANHWARCWLYQ